MQSAPEKIKLYAVCLLCFAFAGMPQAVDSTLPEFWHALFALSATLILLLNFEILVELVISIKPFFMATSAQSVLYGNISNAFVIRLFSSPYFSVLIAMINRFYYFIVYFFFNCFECFVFSRNNDHWNRINRRKKTDLITSPEVTSLLKEL